MTPTAFSSHHLSFSYSRILSSAVSTICAGVIFPAASCGRLLAIIYVAMVGTVALIFLALPLILKAYNLSDQTAAAATNIIHFHGISAMIIWPLSFALPAAYRAAGDAKACMYTSIVSMWIFRIGFSYLVGKYMGLGVFGVWVAMVIDWVVRAICFIIRYFNGKWKHGAIV